MTQLVDVNVWVALKLAGHPHHEVVSSWWAQNEAVVHFCRVTQQGFLRLMSNENLTTSFGAPSYSNAQAIKLYTELLDMDRVQYHDEPHGLEAAWFSLASSSLSSHRVWTDAYLAAFAISASLQFTTLDKDFLKFQNAGLNLHLLT